MIGGAGVLGLSGIAVWVWIIAIQVIGLREAHDTTTGKALGAIFLPILAAFCCAGAFGGLMFAGLRAH